MTLPKKLLPRDSNLFMEASLKIALLLNSFGEWDIYIPLQSLRSEEHESKRCTQKIMVI